MASVCAQPYVLLALCRELGNLALRKFSPSFSGEMRNIAALEGKERNSLAWLLPKHAGGTIISGGVRWVKISLTVMSMSSQLPLHQASVLLGLTQILILPLSLLPFLSSVEMKNSWSASSL